MWTAVVLRAVCLACLLVIGAQPTHAKRIPRWWMKVTQRQGPNACVVEEVPNTGLEFWTECRYWLSRKVCGRRTRVRFECCEGFERNGQENGCTRVKPLVNLLETAESLGATKWAQYIRESGLAGELEGAAAYTLFAPTNEAFENLRRSLKSQMDAYRGSPNNPILLYHMLPTKLLSDDFQADMLAETRYQGHSVRVNKYSNGMITINCALLIRKDQHATNGVVHLISNVLDPSIGIGRNVVDIVLGDGRFSVLADLLERSGYINRLRTMQGSVTVLAPSDEAFQKLPESRREKIINDSEARLALVQNHIIPHVICESAVTGEHNVTTALKDKLRFSCGMDGTYVETTKMRGNFNLGQNGIIHMIDDVLLPDRAKNLLELAESRQLYTFVELVKTAGLEGTLSHTGDYTFFVPDEASWYALDSQVLDKARRDLDLAGQLVRFHGAYGRHLTNAITDNQAIMTLNEEDPVRLQVWRRALGVEDARIMEPDLEAQNGVIHIINKVITPSNQSLADVLRSLPGHSFETFLGAVERVSQEGEAGALLSLGPGDEVFYTFFVPTDRAFRRVNQAMLRRLRQDEAFTQRVVRQHVAVNMFPETSFEKNLVYTVNGMAGPFDVKKTKDNILKVNGEEVVSSHLCANGVIHVINKAFMPESYIPSVQHETYGETEGVLGFPLPSRTSTSRTYKVSFAKRYNGVTQDLPGVPQGSGDDFVSARASRRKTVKRGRGGGSSSTSSSTTLPPPAAVTSLPSLASLTTKDMVEETHLEGTRLETPEDEVPSNTLIESSGGPRDSYDEPVHYNEPGLRDGHGSRPRHPEGSYSVRDGSYSSISYNPSVTTSSTTTSTVTSSYSSTSLHGVQEDEEEEKEKQSMDDSQREAGSGGGGGERNISVTSDRSYDPDLDGSSSSSSSDSLSGQTYDSDLDRGSSSSSSSSSSAHRRHDPDLDSSILRRGNEPDRDEDSSSSSSSSSISHRRNYPDLDRYDTNLDRNHSSSSSSSSISSLESTSRRRYSPNLDNSNRNFSSSTSSSDSSTARRRYDPNFDRNPSSFSSFDAASRRRYDSGLNRGSSFSSSSSSRRRYGSDLDSTSSSSSSRPRDPDADPGHSSTSSSFSIEHSTIRTRFESPSGNPSPLPVPPRLPDGQDSASRSFLTNYTRYSSQDRTTSRSQGTSTNLAGTTTMLEKSNTESRGAVANRRDFGSSLRESNTNSRGTNVRGSSTDVRGSTGGVRGSSPDVRSFGTELESDSDVRSFNTDLSGSTASRNSNIDSRRTSTVIRGSNTNRRVSSTDIRGSNTDLRGSNSAVRGSSTNIRGSSTISSGSSTGIRGSSSIVRGSTTDLRGSGRVAGSSGPVLQREADTHAGDSSGVGASGGYTTTSSRIYSYEYSGGTNGHDPYPKPSTSSPSLRPSPLARDSTAGSATTGGRRFSYVGHGYGQDVVGHTDQLSEVPRPSPLPYHLRTEGHGIRSLGEGSGSVRALEGGVSAGSEGVGKSVYKYSKTSHVQQHLHGPHALQPAPNMHGANNGRSTTTIGSVRSSTKRRYNITKTSYSYSVPVLNSRFSPPIRSGDNKLGSLSPVSAYAFTGDEDMYADGTEFAELKGVGLESITRQEARELRRRFRKKRHHKRRGGAKGRRRRGRRGRRNQAHQNTATTEAKE